MVKIMQISKNSRVLIKNAIISTKTRDTGIYKYRNLNNALQERLAKFAIIKYHINFWNDSIWF